MAFEVEESPKTPAEQLAERIGLRKTTRRQEIWLWLHLYYERIGELLPKSCGGLSMQGDILDTLSRATYLRSDEIKTEIDQQLVPDEQLSWITEDERQLSWLRRHLPREVQDLPWRLVHLTDREHLIARLDIWDADPAYKADLADKADLIKNLHQDWNRHTARDSDFDWFRERKTEAERCKCAWEWLEKKYLHPTHRRERIDSYQTLLMFFDREDLTREKQQDMVKKIKQRWNRQQLDVRNPESKQVNVMLTAETINQLDRLAKQHGLSRVKVVAKLIDKESDQGLYLAE